MSRIVIYYTVVKQLLVLSNDQLTIVKKKKKKVNPHLNDQRVLDYNMADGTFHLPNIYWTFMSVRLRARIYYD